MKIWVDAHITPAIAKWIKDEFQIEAFSLRGLGLRDSEDEAIFYKARSEDVIFITKDENFLNLLERLGSPPKIIWLRTGNTSNEELRAIFKRSLQDILKLLETGNDLVEVGRF